MKPVYESSMRPLMASEPSRILMVEDSPSDVFLFRMMLDDDPTGREYIITDVPKLTDAFKRLAAMEEYDLIILDMNLLDMDGVTSVVVLNAEAPDVPIIVYSGMDSPLLKQKALDAGARRYLVKGTESIHTIKKIIDEVLYEDLKEEA